MTSNRLEAPPRLNIPFISLAIFIFIITRLCYWSETYELPFSDMADFEQVAQNILADFSFKFTDFWQSYKPPVLPLLRAVQVLLTGPDFFYWRVLQLLITLLGLLWFAWEFFTVTKSNLLTFSLLLAVAISKASIFWSYKFATEGLAEGFFYLSFAVSLYAWRRPIRGAFPLGVILTIALMNRPNYALALGIFPALFLLKSLIRRQFLPRKDFTSCVLLYFLGIVLCWGPWMGRTYSIYGKVLPLNTSGPSSFIYGIWNIEVPQDDGTVVTKNWLELMELAPKKFNIDYDFYVWSQGLVSRWFKTHWQEFPSVMLARVYEGLHDRDVQLTKVSRFTLFRNVVNQLLIDKDPVLMLTGLGGLFLLPFLFSLDLILIPALSIHGWILSLVFQGNPRFLEPMIAIFLFGNIAYVILLTKVFRINLNFKMVERFRNRQLWSWLVCGLIAAIFSLKVSRVDSSFEPKNLAVQVVNGDFEEVVSIQGVPIPKAWEFGGGAGGKWQVSSGDAYSGNSSVQISATEGQKALYQDIAGIKDLSEMDFEISAQVKADKEATLYIAVSDGTKWYYSSRNTVKNNWEKIIVKSRTSDTPTSFRVHFYIDSGSAFIDQVSLQAFR